MQSQHPRKRIALADALNARNPKSQYASQMTQMQFASFRQLNDNAKALALAAKTLETDQSSDDMLAFVINEYVEKKRDPEKVIAYSAKLVELMDTKPKPEGASDDDWAKRKKSLSVLAHFCSGSSAFTLTQDPAAATELR